MNYDKNLTIENISNPADFYNANAAELAAVTADSFEQPLQLIKPRLAAQFQAISAGQVLRVHGTMVGYSLYTVLRAHHWQPIMPGEHYAAPGLPAQAIR